MKVEKINNLLKNFNFTKNDIKNQAQDYLDNFIISGHNEVTNNDINSIITILSKYNSKNTGISWKEIDSAICTYFEALRKQYNKN